MTEQKPKIGKKGAAKEIARKFSELRQQPISKDVFRIVDEAYEKRKKSDKKIAKPKDEAEI